MRRLLRLAGKGPRVWGDIAVATGALLRARLVLKQVPTPALLAQVKGDGVTGPVVTSDLAGDWVARVSWAIPAVAARVPWRSDCFIQALAARRWLGRKGLATELRIGARKGPAGELQAHAWLMAGDRVVTGGDIAGFVPFEWT